VRIALGIEYDGAGFVGWQRQDEGRTVQATVERALSRIADSPVVTHCAGRTDTGVHACAQVVHFNCAAGRPDRAWVLGTNSALPPDVSVCWVRKVADDFHARFSAEARTYRYVICNRKTRPGLLAGKVTHIYTPLDAAAMDEAARCLLGRQDFSSFRAAGCQARHAIREVQAVSVLREGEFVILTITANAFLQHMVRNIIGTLLPVGRGCREPCWVADVLDARDRAAAGVTAPPDGLYLEAVRYPERFNLPPAPAGYEPWLPGSRSAHD
jgi:tRNA pseudouridine38-40 synthase